jgi:hypothetical protein
MAGTYFVNIRITVDKERKKTTILYAVKSGDLTEIFPEKNIQQEKCL